MTVSVPWEDGTGAVVLGCAGWWRLRVRAVRLVSGQGATRRLTTRRALLAFAEALDAGRLPAGLSGLVTVEPDPSIRLPYGVVRHPGGSARVALASLAAAARSAAS